MSHDNLVPFVRASKEREADLDARWSAWIATSIEPHDPVRIVVQIEREAWLRYVDGVNGSVDIALQGLQHMLETVFGKGSVQV